MGSNKNFKHLKQNLINGNESAYGKEIREKYGDDAINSSNAKVLNMSETQYARIEQLNTEISEKLKAAMETNNPACELALEVCALHKEWLSVCFGKTEHTAKKLIKI